MTVYEHYPSTYEQVKSSIFIKETSLHSKDHCRKPQPGEKQNCRSQSQWIDLQNTNTPKVHRAFQKRGQKKFKSWRTRYFAVRWCLLITPDAKPMKFYQYY